MASDVVLRLLLKSVQRHENTLDETLMFPLGEMGHYLLCSEGSSEPIAFCIFWRPAFPMKKQETFL